MGILSLVARILLSPKGKLVIERRLWEREKLFDCIAAMVLRCEALQEGERVGVEGERIGVEGERGGVEGERVGVEGERGSLHPVCCAIGPGMEGVEILAQVKPVADLMSMLNLTPFCIIGE